MRNSYVSNLAIYLDQLLKPFLPCGYAVKDTFEFLDKINNANLSSDCFLVLYDVVSLFTNVPLKDTIDYICSLINFSDFVFNRRTLKTLLQMACCDVIFSFNETLYCQTKGVAMGSPLGPILASFAMSKIETQLNNQPLFYARYVDDILCAFHSETEANEFLKELNKSSNSLKFTIEKESNKKIVFF